MEAGWKYTIQPGGCTSWRGDLDHNGDEDLIITTFNPTSDEKDVTLPILMIDELGKPVPWQVTGYFAVDDRGVRDLLDLDNDGRAELAYLHMEGDKFEGQRSLTSFYRAQDAHWQRLSGRFAGVLFPIVRPPGARFSEAPDLSTTVGTREAPLIIKSLVPGIKENCGVQLQRSCPLHSPLAEQGWRMEDHVGDQLRPL